MNFGKIESKARELQISMWKERSALWHRGCEPHPMDMLDPEKASILLGLQFEYADSLGRFGHGNDKFEVAGLIDRQIGKIAVSRRFSQECMRFTGAHEIGHWLMHDREVMHRDRPVYGVTVDREKRSFLEKEADYFAACFLVPQKLLISAFKEAFQTEIPLQLNDHTAFALSPTDHESLLRSEGTGMDFALALASATTYNRRHINSLASRFRVSNTTMAIRIKELGLIEE
jgi:hypothetical protein